MPDPVDAHLAALTLISSTALDGLEANVFAAIDRRARDTAAARRIGTWSVAGALMLGLAGGGIVGGVATPARAGGPMGGDGALAPSTLLLGR